jgi:hypothetical protein
LVQELGENRLMTLETTNRDFDIDIEKIMEEIRDDIKSRGLQNDIPAFEEVVRSTTGGSRKRTTGLTFESEYLDGHCFISTTRTISSHRKGIGPVIVLLKKMIHRLNKFSMEPIVQDQNDFNAHVAYAVDMIKTSLEEKDQKIAELQRQIDDLMKNNDR